MRVLSRQALKATPGIHAQESGSLRKVAGGETPFWELDDQMMGASLETDEVPEELRTEGRKSIFEKNFKKTVMDSGEKISPRKESWEDMSVMWEEAHQSGQRKSHQGRERDQ